MTSTLVSNENIVISILLFQLIKIPALPIHNGFSVKFNNGILKGDFEPQKFTPLFDKVEYGSPPELTEESPQEVSQQTITPETLEGLKYTNDLAKVLFPTSVNLLNKTDKIRTKKEILNIPSIKGINETYKVIVAQAPSSLKLGGTEDPDNIIVYIVFTEEVGSQNIKLPQIYFVNKNGGMKTSQKKESIDPVILVDNNRTVTGLRSTEISKYVKFKSKKANRMFI